MVDVVNKHIFFWSSGMSFFFAGGDGWEIQVE